MVGRVGIQPLDEKQRRKSLEKGMPVRTFFTITGPRFAFHRLRKREAEKKVESPRFSSSCRESGS